MDNSLLNEVARQLDFSKIAAPLIKEAIESHCERIVRNTMRDIIDNPHQTALTRLLKEGIERFLRAEHNRAGFSHAVKQAVYHVLANNFTISINSVR